MSKLKRYVTGAFDDDKLHVELKTDNLTVNVRIEGGSPYENNAVIDLDLTAVIALCCFLNLCIKWMTEDDLGGAE